MKSVIWQPLAMRKHRANSIDEVCDMAAVRNHFEEMERPFT